MNREQWQQKRGRARAPIVPVAIALAEVAQRDDVADPATGTVRPAGVGEQVQTEESAVAVRRRKP